MKKIRSLFIIILSCLILASCVLPSIKSKYNTAEGAEIESRSTQPVHVNNEQDYKINLHQFTITDEITKTSGQTQRSTSINISFPEITGMNHVDVQKK